MNKDEIGRGVFFLYIEAITMMFSGYIYWLILSKITSPSVIGISSTVISLVTIFMTIAGIGVTGGSQRFLGKSLLENKLEDIKNFINSSVLIVGLGIAATSMTILVLREWIYLHFELDFMLLILLILIMGTSVIAGLFRGIIIPSLKIKVLTVSSIVATITKVSLTTILVLIGIEVSGILMGFLFYQMVFSLITALEIKKILGKIFNYHYDFSISYESVKKIFHASIPFWIPGIITTVGTQLGTILVFISNGANFAGVYFIAFSIVSGISLIMSVLSTIAYPIIGSMEDGRKRAVWKLIKLSLVLTLPLSCSVIAYSTDIMYLFGIEYVMGSSNLQILMLSILPTSIISGTGVLVYSYGNNKLVLIIGLFTSIPRVLLYFIFVPIFGPNGAALTYLVGTIIGCIVSIIVANKISLKIFWKQVLLISIIPLVFVIPFKIFDINFIFGILGTVIISPIVFLKIRLITIEDLRDISRVLPKKIAEPLLAFIAKLLNKL